MEIPASLSIGTQVSAKYKGAFCEAKVKSVLKQVKCRLTFSSGHGSATLSDEFIRIPAGGSLSVGSLVEARHPEKLDYLQATINKIQDQSQYTVVFDDGDITTLRRNALCMKSGKHYNASESLDNLPLTHPEHFSTPVSGSRRRKRVPKESEPENEESSSSDNEEGVSSCYLSNIGRVVWTENTENKKSKVKETWFPALIVAPSASDTVKINTKEEFLIRSFKDGRYYTVRKKDTNQFKKDSPKKSENPLMKEAMDKAISYMETKELPPHWDKEHLFNMGGAEESSTESSESEEIEDDEDEESREEKDHLVAELYKHMEDRGAPINRTPNIVGKDLDLYKLFRIVYKYGGHQRVTNNNKWRQIAHKLGFETTWCVNQVRVNYKRYLQSFEELYKTLGCTMKSGSSTKQRQNSGNGSSGRVQIRGRSREMLKQQLSSSKDSSSSSQNEDTASESSKDMPLAGVEGPPEEKDPLMAPLKKTSLEETAKEEDVEETVPKVTDEPKTQQPPVSVKKVSKEKKMSLSASKSESSIRKGKEEPKPLGTRNRRDSCSSFSASSAQVKAQKTEDQVPSAKKSLAKELSEIDVNKKSTKPSSKSDAVEETPPPPPKASKGRKKHKESKKAVSSQSTSGTSSGNACSGNNPSSTCNSADDTSDNKSRSSDSAGEEEAQHLSPDVDVRVGDKIKVFYIRGIIYDAKVIKCQEQEKNNSKWPRYYVHYQGWNARYDEWINRSRIAENLSWSKDRPKKDGKEDSSDGGNVDKPAKKEKSKVDGRKERKIVKRDSSSRASTPGKGQSIEALGSTTSSSKRGTRGVRKMESDHSDKEEDDSDKNGSLKSPTPVRVSSSSLSKKIVTPSSSQKRGRGRKRKEESENEEVDIEKEDANEESAELIPSSPTKAKRGRKSNKESQGPSVPPIAPPKKEENLEEALSIEEESSNKCIISRATPLRESRPSNRSTYSSKSKDSDKKPSMIKKEEEVEHESSDTANVLEKEVKSCDNVEDEEDPYAFKEPEPFEEVKFETPPRKVFTPPSSSLLNSSSSVSPSPLLPKKNLETELSTSPLPRANKESPHLSPSEEEESSSEMPCAVEPSLSIQNKDTSNNPSSNVMLHKVEEDDEDDVEDSDDEGKLEIVTPKKDFVEESPRKSPSEDVTPLTDSPPCESIDQPSVIIEIKKSPEKPSDDPGKPVLQLTEKQKELFPFLSAIRTASLGSITNASVEGSKDDPSPQEIKIEVLTSPAKKPVAPQCNSTGTTTLVSASEKSNSLKKRKSHRRFNSSELVIESESESDEEEAKTKEPQTVVKVMEQSPSAVCASLSNSTKTLPSKKVIKKDHDVDDVDLACAETIPGSPVHPGIVDATEVDEEVCASVKSESLSKVVEVKKLEMPFATVPESGLGPALPDESPGPSITTKKITSKTEKKELETSTVLVSSTKLPSPDALPLPVGASIISTKDNMNDPPSSPTTTTTTSTTLTNPTTSFKNDADPSATPSLPLGYKSPAGDSSDIDSNSGKIKLEPEDSRLDVDGSSSSEPLSSVPNQTSSSSTRRNSGLNKRKVTTDKSQSDAPRSPAQKRKRRTRDVNSTSGNPMSSLTSRYRGSTRGRHGSGRGVGLRGNLMDEETDESEETKDSTLNSLGSLDDQALIALSQRSPKSSRYNFCVDLDPSMNSSERISLIQQNLEELRKTYLNIKSELAVIERRRKKIRRKERDRGSNSINSSSSGSNSGGTSKSNPPAHIEVTA